MSLKLKALGLSLIAAMAISAVAVMSASANVNGHFVTTGNSHAHILGSVISPHKLHLVNHGLEGEIGCTTQSYTVTTTTETTSSLTVTPFYANCHTTSNAQAVTVTVNKCTFTFRAAQNTVDATEQTSHLLCPAGVKGIEIHHPNCTVTVPPQTINTGLTYTTKGSGNTHDITLDVNVGFTSHRHGLCQFIAPTVGTGTLKGNATVQAFNTAGDQIPITAT